MKFVKMYGSFSIERHISFINDEYWTFNFDIPFMPVDNVVDVVEPK